MAGTKRKLSNLCPLCDSRIERFIINIDCEISMCESVKCSYPFNEQSAEGLNIETPNTSFIRYSKTNSKSSLSNTVAVPTPDDNNIAKSVKRARTGFNKPVSSSSSERKQKDKLHFTKSSDSDVLLATPTHPAKNSLQIDTFTPADTSNKQQPKTNSAAVFTPPPETNDQEPKSSASSITTTSPSTASSFSSLTMNLLDFPLPSPTSSIFGDSLSSQSNYNITQKPAAAPPPPAAAVAVAAAVAPSGLCLPPMTAAISKVVLPSNTPSIHDYTLGDIESLLTIDNVNPLSQNNAQPEELSWMEDYNDLFM